MIVDTELEIQAWIGYKEKIGNVYVVGIRVWRQVLVGNFFGIKVGVDALGVQEAYLYKAQYLFERANRFFYEGDQIALLSENGIFEWPEDVKLDKITAPMVLSDYDYNVYGAVLSWFHPTCYAVDLYYIPVEDSYSEIPDEIEGLQRMNIDPPDTGENSAYFQPPITSYFESFEIVSSHSSIGPQTNHMVKWGFAYEGQDLPGGHIVISFTEEYPFDDPPRVHFPWEGFITGQRDSNRGFDFYGEGTAVGYQVRVNVWYHGDDKKLHYYPPRLPPSGKPAKINIPRIFVPYGRKKRRKGLGYSISQMSSYSGDLLIFEGEKYLYISDNSKLAV
jgi:hypothetical protein